MSIESTLAERGNRYGDFADHAKIAQAIQCDMRISAGWSRLDDVKRQALTVIADKIARILSGDPNYADNWHDIQGYARLVEDRLPVDRADQADANIASAIDDDSERQKLVQQNGEMAAEVYAAVYGAPSWNCAPVWANWLAQDMSGMWFWFDKMPRATSDEEWFASRDDYEFAADGAENSLWRTTLQARPAK